jgi:hypothetical protein
MNDRRTDEEISSPQRGMIAAGALPPAAVRSSGGAPVLLHVVMWRLVDRADAEPLRERLLRLSGCVPGLLSLEAGIALETDLADGADVVLVTRFRDAAALAAYLEHPEHQALAGWLRPRRAERRVVDCRP